MVHIKPLNTHYSEMLLDRLTSMSTWSRYLLPIAMVALGYGISRVFGHLLDVEIYLLPFVSILVASVVGGLGPGLLGTVLGAAATYYLVSGISAAQLSPLVIEGALVSVVGGWLRRERVKAREHLETTLQLEQQILEISEDERRRIGHDLHDGLGQYLSGIALLSETIALQVMAGEHVDLTKVETITRLVSEAVGITRDLASSLSPVTLESEGLVPAIAELAETSSSILGIRCVLETHAQEFKLETVRSVHVFRIVQEAITNSVRHGKAKNVQIELVTDHRLLRVTVTDDGIGLSAKTRARPGLGLRVMQYRATILGASLTVERTTAVGGTTVICNCPL